MKREERPEAEYFREAFHIAALRSRRWDEEWDIPAFDFGGPLSAKDVKVGAARSTTDER